MVKVTTRRKGMKRVVWYVSDVVTYIKEEQKYGLKKMENKTLKEKNAK